MRTGIFNHERDTNKGKKIELVLPQIETEISEKNNDNFPFHLIHSFSSEDVKNGEAV